MAALTTSGCSGCHRQRGSVPAVRAGSERDRFRARESATAESRRARAVEVSTVAATERPEVPALRSVRRKALERTRGGWAAELRATGGVAGPRRAVPGGMVVVISGAGWPAPATAPSTMLVRTWPGLPPTGTRPLAAAVVASSPTTATPAMVNAPPVPPHQ